MVDTTKSPINDNVWIKKGIQIGFYRTGMIHVPLAPADTILEVPWTAIDTTLTDVRAGFKALYDSVGPFVLRKITPNDTTGSPSVYFKIRFLSYTWAGLAMGFVTQIPKVTWREPYPMVPAFLPNDQGLIPGVKLTDVESAAPAEDVCRYGNSAFHRLGWEWALYKMKCPMAWEITSGKTYDEVNSGQLGIFIGIDDVDWSTSATTNISSPDISAITSANINGNFLYLAPGHQVAGDPQNQGDGPVTYAFNAYGSSPIYHGCTVTASAVGLGNNAVQGGVMLGSAYGATALAVEFPATTDVDHIANNVTTHLDVDNASRGGLIGPNITPYALDDPRNAEYQRYRQPMQNGTVVVVCAGNDLDQGWGLSTPVTDFDNKQVTELRPARIYPASDVWLGATPAQDVKPIAVGSTSDGIIAGCARATKSNCLLYPDEEPDPSTYLYHWTGDAEPFTFGWAFSPGHNKFSTTTNTDFRREDKAEAYMDLVAPGVDMLDIDPTNPSGYSVGTSGTSYSAPLVSGVVALMRSVNRWLSCDDSKPSDLTDVHRKAYDILTFTADKIPDQLWSGDRYQLGGVYYRQPTTDQQGNAYHLNYENQGPVDPLNRSWCQRMGFGQVNAYRAVAHSISKKADPSYSSSQTLDFTTNGVRNEKAQWLMHMGAWKDASSTNCSNLVINAGGNPIPNQIPIWPHYNQGLTLVSNGSTLTVPDGCILAIDGLLESGDGNEGNITSNDAADGGHGTAKILVAGYVQDVCITGDIKADDLILYSSNSMNHGQLHLGNYHAGEIYGVVKFQNYGYIADDDGSNLIIQPGGEIHLDGNEDFVINGSVTMEASSKIISSSKEVKVYGNLTIVGPLPVDIDAKLHIMSGGQVLIQGGAYLRLDQFLIDYGGAFTCLSGGRLTLNKSLRNVCYGNISFAGSPTSRCILTGGITSCGQVNQLAGIDVRPIIETPGAMPTPAFISMQYTDDSDVGIFTYDASKDHFVGDCFSENSEFYAQGFSTQMLYCNYSKNLIYSLPEVTTAWLTDCRFFDESTNSFGNRIFDCFWGSNLQQVMIEQCRFHNARTGCNSYYCQSVLGNSNIFGKDISGNPSPLKWYGIYNSNCRSTYCNSDISYCKNGGIMFVNHSHGFLFDNSFSFDDNWCITAQSNSNCLVRNNGLLSYSSWGGWSLGAGSLIQLDDNSSNYINYIFFDYGKCHLDAISPNPHKTAALVRGGNKGVHGGNLVIRCGYNDFGPNNSTHLLNMDHGLSYLMDVSFNDFEPGGSAITQGVTAYGSPQNVPTPSGHSHTDCQDHTDAPDCDPTIADPYPSLLLWTTVSSGSDTLRTIFWNASGMLRSDTNDVNIRLQKASDELWFATLTDSATAYIQVAITDYNTVIAEPGVAPELVSGLWMAKGSAYETLGQISAAVACYDSVLYLYHSYSDSIYAQWNLQRLTIPEDPSSMGFDSLLNTYLVRVNRDIIWLQDTVDGPAPKTNAQKNRTEFSMQNGLTVTAHPNPARDKATVCVEELPEGLPATIAVVNAAGEQVALLYNDTPQGDMGFCVNFNCSKLPSGVYYVQVQNSIMGKAVKLVKE